MHRILLFSLLLTVACSPSTEPPSTSAGPILWSYQGAGVAGVPYADEEIAVFTTAFDNQVIAVDAVNGKLLWKKRVPIPPQFRDRGMPRRGSVIAFNDLLIVPAWDVFALDRSTGDIRWRYSPPDDFPGAGTAVPAEGNRVILTGRNLHLIDASTGAAVWEQNLGEQPFDPIYENGVVYLGTRGYINNTDVLGAGHAMAIDVTSGRILWKHPIPDAPDTTWLGGAVGRGALTEDLFIVAGRNGRIYALERATGRLRWETRGSGPYDAAITIVGNVAVTGGDARFLEAFDVRDGHRVWTKNMGGSTSYITQGPGFALIPNGRVYILGENGETRWEFGGQDRGLPGFDSPATYYGGRVYVGAGPSDRYPAAFYALQPKLEHGS